ncbi:MAG: DNA-protecting protein DprA [Fibrobacteres bacterium]|nr:DNA-protecting protein DprA [Fibrobacterota bacterium]
MNSRTALIAFTAVESLGPVSLQKLLSRFSTPEEVWSAGEQELKSKGVSSQTIEAILRVNPENFADKQLTSANKLGAKIVLQSDSEYPECLKSLSDAPTVLFVHGVMPNSTDLPGVAIVGTRKPSAYGKKIAAQTASELVSSEVTVISGYAAGIDAAAHEAAASAGGKTLAVLGCGLDYDYPAHNRTLRPQIIERGALISEFPFGTSPVPWHFPRRNRIVSGLSRAVAVIEAGAKSGALITAKSALDQGREIFSVPGPIDSPLSIGTNRLIQDGAHPLLQTSDLLLLWKREKKRAKVPLQIEIPLDENEQKLLTSIDNSPLHIDTLVDRSGLNAQTLMPVLLSLEIKGAVIRHPGMCFSRAG